jgi:hypothetical protein
MVTPKFVGSLPPTAMGGPVADGKWMQTAYTVFTGPGGQPIQLGDLDWVSSVWMITAAGARLEEVTGSQSEGEPDSPRTDTFAISVNGTSLNFEGVCPCEAVASIPFTATANELDLYELVAVGVTVDLTFTKQ